MIVGFFEEELTETNLQKLGMIQYPFNLHLAAPGMPAFLEALAKAPDTDKVQGMVYWPRLTPSEGNWVGPLADAGALDRVANEILEAGSIPIAWDPGIPKEDPKKILFGLGKFKEGRKKIQLFLLSCREKGIPVSTVEDHMTSELVRTALVKMGFQFPPAQYANRRIVRLYGDQVSNNYDVLLEELKTQSKACGGKMAVMVGPISVGPSSPTVSINVQVFNLALDLCVKAHVEEVIVYRLAGITQDHLDCMDICYA